MNQQARMLNRAIHEASHNGSKAGNARIRQITSFRLAQMVDIDIDRHSGADAERVGIHSASNIIIVAPWEARLRQRVCSGGHRQCQHNFAGTLLPADSAPFTSVQRLGHNLSSRGWFSNRGGSRVLRRPNKPFCGFGEISSLSGLVKIAIRISRPSTRPWI
jgi:hypothetical protein